MSEHSDCIAALDRLLAEIEDYRAVLRVIAKKDVEAFPRQLCQHVLDKYKWREELEQKK